MTIHDPGLANVARELLIKAWIVLAKSGARSSDSVTSWEADSNGVIVKNPRILGNSASSRFGISFFQSNHVSGSVSQQNRWSSQSIVFFYPIWVNYALNNIMDVTPKIVNRKDLPTKPQSGLVPHLRSPHKAQQVLESREPWHGAKWKTFWVSSFPKICCKNISFKLPLATNWLESWKSTEFQRNLGLEKSQCHLDGFFLLTKLHISPRNPPQKKTHPRICWGNLSDFKS